MLAQRRRRWGNISPALGQRLEFAGSQVRLRATGTDCVTPVTERFWSYGGVMMGHCLRRWPNIKLRLGEIFRRPIW